MHRPIKIRRFPRPNLRTLCSDFPSWDFWDCLPRLRAVGFKAYGVEGVGV